LVLLGESESIKRGRQPGSIKEEVALDLVLLTHGSPAAVLGFERCQTQHALPGFDFGQEIIEKAIYRTKEARTYILDEVMAPVISKPRPEVGPYSPKIVQIKIDPSKIGEVVGQRGKTINAIIDQTGVKIDITDDGAVSVCGLDKESIQKAVEMVKMIVTDFEEGKQYVGKVISIKEFGAFIEFAPGKEGMVHISKIAKHRVEHVEDVLTLGDVVKVVCLGQDKMGRVSFSIKDAQ
jgi:polyribonucleotide nucleotidyltransferase